MGSLSEGGFTPPAPGHEPRMALAQLIATAALALSTLIIVTVLSIGVASAGVLSSVAADDGLFFVLVFFAALVAGIVGLMAVDFSDSSQRQH